MAFRTRHARRCCGGGHDPYGDCISRAGHRRTNPPTNPPPETVAAPPETQAKVVKGQTKKPPKPQQPIGSHRARRKTGANGGFPITHRSSPDPPAPLAIPFARWNPARCDPDHLGPSLFLRARRTARKRRLLLDGSASPTSFTSPSDPRSSIRHGRSGGSLLGGYPARFGRYAGGIAAAETTAPNATLRGEGSVRLLRCRSHGRGGFAGGRGTVLLGGRYSYTAANHFAGRSRGKARLPRLPSSSLLRRDARDQVSVTAFGAYDLLAQDVNGITTIGFGTEFYRGDLRWDISSAKTVACVRPSRLAFDQTANRRGTQRTGSHDWCKDRGRQAALYQTYGCAPVSTACSIPTSHNPIHYDPDDPNVARFATLFPQRKDAVIGVPWRVGD